MNSDVLYWVSAIVVGALVAFIALLFVPPSDID